MPETNVTDFIGELGAGVFEQKLALALSECALGVIHNGNKKGKVTVQFDIGRVGENDQVIIGHTLTTLIPTRNGSKGEKNQTVTPMFVGKGGVLTVNPPIEEDDGQFNLAAVPDRKQGE